ncbi:ankyrin repeat domain-containing protein [Streptomyces sp. NPDC049954]|uniref:ankyrin repeat domain-containing protein n=1 Tax=Streptomyces sp. NPDC049954 TaxID=3155779 RepID=UPI003446B16B
MNRRTRKKLVQRLVEAAMFGEPADVRRLLAAGAPAESADRDGTTPLYAASVHGAAESAVLLLAAGAQPGTESAGVGAEGTPLCAACAWGHEDTVRVLLGHGADPNQREDHGSGNSPLYWASSGPYPGTVAVLRAAGAVDDVTP